MNGSKYCRIFLFLFLSFILVPISSASILSDFFDQEYIESVYELPESIPDTEWHDYSSKGHIWAYVYIQGFRHMIRDNGTFYVYGNPINYTIIQSDVQIMDWWGTYGPITKTFAYSYNNTTNIVYVTMQVNVDLLFTRCNEWGQCHTQVFPMEAHFKTCAIAPNQFILPNEQNITVIRYNGSYYQSRELNINASHGIMSYNVSTEEGYLKQYLNIGQTKYTSKGIPYMNLTKIDYFIQSGTNISKRGMDIVTTSNITNIIIKTPYSDLNMNISETEMPETYIDMGIFGVIYLVFVFCGGIFLMIRSIST